MQTRVIPFVLITLGVAVIGASLFAMYDERQNAAAREMLKPVTPGSTDAAPVQSFMRRPGQPPTLREMRQSAALAARAEAAKVPATPDERDRSRKLSAEAGVLLDSYRGNLAVLAEASSKLEQALTLDDHNVDAYFQLARYQMKSAGMLNLDVLTRAEQSLRKGLTLDPQHGDSYVLLGSVLAHRGNVKAATEAFNKGHELSPTNPWFDIDFAEMLMRQGDTEGAMRHYETAINTPTSPARARAAACEEMARQYLHQGKYDLAAAAHGKAIELQPDDAWAMGNYSVAVRISKLDTKESELWARRALEKMDYGFGRQSLGDTLYLKWAEALIKEKDSAKAEKLYTEAQRYSQSPDELLHEIPNYPRPHPIIEALAARGYSLDHFPEIESGSGDTPIAATVAGKNLPILEHLLAAGANIDAPGYKGVTALMVAANTGNLPMTKFLLGKGANPYLLETGGLDAESMARTQNHTDVAALIAKAKQRSPEKRNAPSPDGLPRVGHHYRALKDVSAGEWNDKFSAGDDFIYERAASLKNSDKTPNTEFVGLRFLPTKGQGTRNWALKKSTPNDWSNYFEEVDPAKLN
jgi:tetratricopeptide (TPR) repeat protein